MPALCSKSDCNSTNGTTQAKVMVDSEVGVSNRNNQEAKVVRRGLCKHPCRPRNRPPPVLSTPWCDLVIVVSGGIAKKCVRANICMNGSEQCGCHGKGGRSEDDDEGCLSRGVSSGMNSTEVWCYAPG